MENSYAEMVCILKVNTQCDDCKRKVMMILRRIRGVYNITIDGEEGSVKVTGKVNPNTLLSVLERYGKHAELKYVKFDGEVVERNSTPPNYYGEYSNAYAPHSYNSSYPPPHLHPQHQWYNPNQQFYQQPRQAMYSYPCAPSPQHFSPAEQFWAPQQPQSQPPSHPHGYGPIPLQGSFWAPQQPPTPSHPHGYGPIPLQGSFWAPQQPPQPSHIRGYGPIPPQGPAWGPQPQPQPQPPPNHFPTGETSSENRESKCAIM